MALGAVEPRRARIWARVHLPGSVRLTYGIEGSEHPCGEVFAEVAPCNETDNTVVFAPTGLEPLQRYWFRVNRAESGKLVGEGSFETAPEPGGTVPGKFSIGLASCHQPFDDDGAVREDARQMLRAARKCFRENDTKLAFWVGDQMYSDKPKGFSIFDDAFFQAMAPEGRDRLLDCSVEELRRIYQQRYRTFFNLPEWNALQAQTPCYPIWDDHEIVDNWGTAPQHRDEDWQRVGEGARRACHDYQLSRVMPWQPDRAFQYAVEYGNTATWVMDLRSERRAGDDGRIVSDEQIAEFEEFLAAHCEKAVIFVALSVPPVHLPRGLTKGLSWMTPMGNDFDDRWSTWADRFGRDRLMRLIHEHQMAHPGQHVVILSGDIHIGCVHAMRWDGSDDLVMHQVISSGLTKRVSGLIAGASKLLIGANRFIATENGDLKASVRLVPGVDNHEENPLGRLNFALIEVDPQDDGRADLTFKLFGHRKGEPVCEFESEPIRGERG